MQLSIRQALVVSLALHLFLVPGVGWLAGSLTKADVSQVIELELGGSSSGGGGNPAMLGNTSSYTGNVLHTSPTITAPTLSTRSEIGSATETQPAGPAIPVTDESVVPHSEMQNTGSGLGSGMGVGVGSGSGSGSGTGSGAGNGTGNGTGTGTGNGADWGSGSGSGKEDSTILAPQVLERIEPEYPLPARRANQEGVVSLRIEILINGLPGTIQIARSSGYEALDAAAEAAVRRWRFIPARNSRSGTSVASVTVVPIAFRLR